MGATVRLSREWAARAEASKIVAPGAPSQGWSYRAGFRFGSKQ